MKLSRLFLLALFTIAGLFQTEISAKGKIVPEMYIFGFSASFKDSVVYFTEINKIDSAWIDSKTGFLLGRDNYAYQLKNYLTQDKNNPNRTCIVIFDKNKGFILTNIPYIRTIRNKFTDFLCFASPSGAIHKFSVFTPPAPDKAACKLPLIEQLLLRNATT